MPCRWFDKWKSFIEYDELKSFTQIDTPSSGREPNYPGPITYKELLADDKEYLHNYSAPERLRDVVIKHSAEEGKNYFVVSKDLYEYLQENYGGEAILRHQLEIGCNGLKKYYPKLIQVCNDRKIIGENNIYKARKDFM